MIQGLRQFVRTRLASETRQRMQSSWWSIGIHTGLLIILALITFRTPSKTKLELVVSCSSDPVEFEPEIFEIEVMEAPKVIEPEEEEPVEVTEDQAPLETEFPSAELASSSTPANGKATQDNSSPSDPVNPQIAKVNKRVKVAGGKTDALIRISLAWDTIDDLDLHVTYAAKNADGRRQRFWASRSRGGSASQYSGPFAQLARGGLLQ